MGRTTLKWYPRLEIFKNSTGTCKYDPRTHEGYSYDHWQVCGIIEGIPFFNNYSYSVTTSSHQSALIDLFTRDYASGTKIIHVPCADGLQDNGIKTLSEILKVELEKLEAKADKGREKSATGRWRRQFIDVIKNDLLYLVNRGFIAPPVKLKPQAGYIYADDLTDSVLEDL